MTGAISAGLQGLSSLVSGISSKLSGAMNIQQQNIATAGTLMKIIGFSFKESSDFIDDFATNMSKVAAVLPGATSDYVSLGKGIMDNLVPAFKELNGSFDKAGYTEALNSITRDAGFLGAANQVDTAGTSRGVSNFLGGVSTKRLQGLEFFRANPSLIPLMEAEAKKIGVNIEKATAKQRVKILSAALKTPQEVIDASVESVSGLVESLKSSVFDPQTGVFGLLRNLKPEKKGGPTALKSINELLKSLIGEGGLVEQTSKALAGLGIVLGDPMVKLKTAADKFNNTIKSLTDIFSQFNNRNPGQTLDDAKETLIADLQFFFGNLFKFDGLGSSLAGITNNFINFLNEVNWTELFQYLGERLAVAVNELADFIIKLDYGKTLDVILKMIGGLFMGLARFLVKINWGKVIVALGVLIGGALLASTAAALLAPVAGIIAAVAGIGLIIIAALEAFGFNWDEMWGGLTGVWNSITSTVTGFFNAIDNFFKDIQKKFDEWKPESKEGQVAKTVIGEIGEANNPLKGGYFGYLWRKLTGGGDKVPGAYNGLNNSSLMSAANRELSKAPAGAGLVMANSSETILNSSQQARIMSAMNSKPGVNIGSIIIQTAATNAQDIARDVVACIEKELQSFGQNYVAAPVV
ncbi:hypothetical protein [Nostoc sp. UHCC 0251]|uniref:hypothetical protein n=1 Tax=Nostoc sp. UHCC 0251 TaxID=3110240 RepID=UPI002B213480|nr:hypothetical protein [Nostoc sp. UHCC 0251]MEA5625318.1 hypothetical protein [Nostoc sp. UHCC 0251]